MMITFLFLAGLLAVYCRWENYHYQVSRHSVKVNKPLSKPLRILHLSDTHFAKSTGRLIRFLKTFSGETYDFIFLTGDIFDCKAGLLTCKEGLRGLESRYGIYAVLGNHDYYDYRLEDIFTHNFPGQRFPINRQPVELLVDGLRQMGVEVLRNTSRTFDCDGHTVCVHGLDDPTTGHANMRLTLENYNPKALNILLTHSVDALLDVGEGEIDLSFSGHSHGGQFRLPGFGAIVTHTTLGRQYTSGIKRFNGALCSISRGLGSGRYMPVRFYCPPEAVILEVEGHHSK